MSSKRRLSDFVPDIFSSVLGVLLIAVVPPFIFTAASAIKEPVPEFRLIITTLVIVLMAVLIIATYRALIRISGKGRNEKAR